LTWFAILTIRNNQPHQSCYRPFKVYSFHNIANYTNNNVKKQMCLRHCQKNKGQIRTKMNNEHARYHFFLFTKYTKTKHNLIQSPWLLNNSSRLNKEWEKYHVMIGKVIMVNSKPNACMCTLLKNIILNLQRNST